MENNNSKVVLQEEFILTFGVDDSRMPITDLSDLLFKTNKLFMSLNKTLKDSGNSGYDDISINVLAFEKGSFKTKINIEKITNNSLVGSTVGTILGGLFMSLFINQANINQAKSPTTPIDVGTIEIVKEFSKILANNENLKSIKFTSKSGEIVQEFELTNRELLEIANRPIENRTGVIKYAELEVQGVDFWEDSITLWLRYSGKDYYFSHIQDNYFAKLALSGEIAFRKGDLIIADINIIIDEKDSGKLDLRCNVKKVHKMKSKDYEINFNNVQ